MARFSDQDPVEESMGVWCEYMSPEQLTRYVHQQHQANGLDLPVGRTTAAYQVFINLQDTYGKKAAGRLVKWVFYAHQGRWKDRPVTYSDFSRGAKWWTDLMHLAVQDHLKKERLARAAATPGVRRLDF